MFEARKVKLYQQANDRSIICSKQIILSTRYHPVEREGGEEVIVRRKKAESEDFSRKPLTPSLSYSSLPFIPEFRDLSYVGVLQSPLIGSASTGSTSVTLDNLLP
jgi:hypothetical protein